MAQISVSMDKGLRKKADAILDEMGLSMSSAFTVFIKQLVRQGGLPFIPENNINTTVINARQERLDSFLVYASKHRKIEKGYKFIRDECYD